MVEHRTPLLVIVLALQSTVGSYVKVSVLSHVHITCTCVYSLMLATVYTMCVRCMEGTQVIACTLPCVFSSPLPIL